MAAILLFFAATLSVLSARSMEQDRLCVTDCKRGLKITSSFFQILSQSQRGIVIMNHDINLCCFKQLCFFRYVSRSRNEWPCKMIPRGSTKKAHERGNRDREERSSFTDSFRPTKPMHNLASFSFQDRQQRCSL